MSRFPADRLLKTDYTSSIDIPVLYGDLDTNYHVNNVTMGRFFEHARYTNNLSLRGLDQELSFLVARVAIDYVTVGEFGIPMTVASRFGTVGTKSMVVEQAAFQGDRVVSICDTVIVRTLDGVPAPIPDDVRREITRIRATHSSEA